MSGPKRTTRSRQRREPITAEMVELYKRGRETLRNWDFWEHDRWNHFDDDGHPYWQFRDISKRLDCELLHRVGQCSVFDDFSGKEPDYMARRSDPAPTSPVGTAVTDCSRRSRPRSSWRGRPCRDSALA